MGESQSDQIADERWKALAAAIRPLVVARRKGAATPQQIEELDRLRDQVIKLIRIRARKE
jgi:hypothetical protein